MCGIFALVHPPENPVSSQDIRCACSLLRHRGPDQAGYALLNGQTVGFGHNRLSIQDPEAPPQPLIDSRTGTAIIFSGEVYDHIELGRTLKEEHGVTLPDSTDTAVVLALYILYGPTPDFFSRLNGEFAFVIWDAQRKHVVAARDRFGIKPLCWYYDRERLVFASEIKAIVSVRGITRKFSTEWLDTLDPVMSYPQHLTFMEGVYNLLPGQYLTKDLSTPRWDAPKYTTYWSALPLLRAPDTSISYEEAKAEVRRLLKASVKRRLVADREMCVYLSGGVDSTVVCGLIHELGHPLTCITIGFGDHIVSEENVAVKTAQHYSLRHKCVTYTLDDTIKYVEKAMYHTEVPMVNPHSIAKFRLSQYARENNFVVSLTGEGSDELLLGYSMFRFDVVAEMRSKGGEQAARARRFKEEMLRKEGYSILISDISDDTPRVRGVPSWQASHFHRLHKIVDALRAPYPDGHSLPIRSPNDFAPVEAEGLPGVRIGQYDAIWRMHNYVFPSLGDRVEMASSLEGRPPILDAAFADFALRLPLDYLIDPNTLREKKILYEAFEDLLPPHIFTRTKQPFLAPPWSEVLFNTTGGQAFREKYLSRKPLEHVGIWSPEKVEEMLLRLEQGDIEQNHGLGLILSVQILHALFIDSELVGDVDFQMIDKAPVSL